MFGLLARLAALVARKVSTKVLTGAKRLLGFNTFNKAKNNFMLKVFATRYLGPMNSLVQPLTRVSFAGSSQFRKMYGGKGFFISKGNMKAAKTVFVGGDNFFIAGKGWQYKNASFLKWYGREVGINVVIDQVVDYKKHRAKALKVQKRLERLKDLPLKRQKQELKRMNAEPVSFNPTAQIEHGKTQMDHYFEHFSPEYQELYGNSSNNLYDWIESGSVTSTHSQEFYGRQGLKSLRNGVVPSGTKPLRTSFPRSPHSWLQKGSFFREYNTMMLTPANGKPFPVHANLNGFDKMAKSLQPGKVLWDGPWFFKRNKSLRDQNVRRRARRKGRL